VPKELRRAGSDHLRKQQYKDNYESLYAETCLCLTYDATIKRINNGDRIKVPATPARHHKTST